MSKSSKTRSILICMLVVTGTFLATSRNVKGDYVFGTPKNLGPLINGPLNDSSATTSVDGLTMLFTRWPASRETLDFMKVTRSAGDSPWDDPVNLGPPDGSVLNRAGVDYMLSFYTADGLEAYASESRADGYGNLDLWEFKRDTVDDDWGPMTNLGPVVNSTHSDSWATVSRDGLELYFQSYNRLGGHGHWDIWVTTRDSRDAPWTEPTNLGPLVNTSSLDARPCLAPDGLILFFDSKRPGGYGICDLYMTKRASFSDPWEQAVNLGSFVNGPGYDEAAFISGDGSTLYFDSDGAGGYGLQDIWQVSIDPVVDLNGDGIVDAADVCIMVDNWGTDNSLCDIGPTPFGDGIVDVEDLIVLAEHLFEEFPPAEPVE